MEISVEERVFVPRMEFNLALRDALLGTISDLERDHLMQTCTVQL